MRNPSPASPAQKNRLLCHCADLNHRSGAWHGHEIIGHEKPVITACPMLPGETLVDPQGFVVAGFALPNKNIGHMKDIERELENKVYEVLGEPGEAKKKVGQILSEMQTEYNLALPKETLRAYGMNEEKFKMTFKNSWWQCLIAILLFKPIVIVLEIIVLYILSSLNLSPDTDLQMDIRDGIYMLTLALTIFLARHLAYRSWKRKQLRSQTMKNV